VRKVGAVDCREPLERNSDSGALLRHSGKAIGAAIEIDDEDW
jgi:hypothetical protein